MKKIALSTALVWLMGVSLFAYAQEWYEGGTLEKADGHEWLEASEENKLASAGGLLKERYDNNQLDPDYYTAMADVKSVDDLRPHAENLVRYTDEVVEGAKGSLGYIDSSLDLGMMMMASDMSEAE